MAVAEGSSGSLFQNLRGDVEELETTQIESLCVACEEDGITKLLLTKIPFYKEVRMQCRNRMDDKSIKQSIYT